MASMIPNSYFDDITKGNIVIGTDTVKVLLLTNAATPNKDTWAKRSDITNEVANGNGYTTGGNTATCSATKDTGNDREDVSLGGTTWPASTITARYAVYYKSRGGAASADELIFINDFGSDVASTAATFTLNSSTLRIQN